MTAAPPTTTKVPLSPLALILFTLAAAGTLLAIPHVIIASMNGWPPQLMTLHAVATFGFWAAGFHYRAHPPGTTPTNSPTWGPGPHHRNRENEIDDLDAGFAALDQKEVDDLERRLRDNDW
jgi:hypothetical protein